jgi:hypothetical protein
MANKEAIMDKIVRNMKARGLDATRTSTGLLSDGLIVSYSDKSGNAPQIGVDSSISPFLGIGVAAPGSIQIEDTTKVAAASIDTAVRMALLSVISGLANDIVILGTDGAANSIRIAGHSDVLGLGE